MPPRVRSRHAFSVGFEDAEAAPGNTLLSEREPFTFRDYPDNVEHTVAEGDSLFVLAARYFNGIPDPSELWWVIADFQPDPIHDPTLRLAVGSTIVVPSVRTVLEEVFNEKRRLETGI